MQFMQVDVDINCVRLRADRLDDGFVAAAVT